MFQKDHPEYIRAEIQREININKTRPAQKIKNIDHTVNP